jgi:hypothetical protein
MQQGLLFDVKLIFRNLSISLGYITCLERWTGFEYVGISDDHFRRWDN